MEPIPTLDLTHPTEAPNEDGGEGNPPFVSSEEHNTDPDFPEPEFFTFLQDERRQAEEDYSSALDELEGLVQEREQMIQCMLEVMDEETYLRKWREQVEYKILKAEAALKIIDDKTTEVYFRLGSSSSEDQTNN